jgi:hypothetical protein
MKSHGSFISVTSGFRQTVCEKRGTVDSYAVVSVQPYHQQYPRIGSQNFLWDRRYIRLYREGATYFVIFGFDYCDIRIRHIDLSVTNKSGLQSFQATNAIGVSSAVVARVLKKVLPGVVTTTTVTDGPGLWGFTREVPSSASRVIS